MENITKWFTDNWLNIIVVYTAFYVFIKAVRDVIDTTPTTDDNVFEKAVTFLGKLLTLLTTGKRPKA